MPRLALVATAFVVMAPLFVMGCVHEYGSAKEAHVSAVAERRVVQ
jgi:hypothetical protein